MRRDDLADVIRVHSTTVAVEVTNAFLEQHPDWRVRYGSRAVSAGVQDAGYHLAFLAAAVEADSPEAFAAYARWAARVLAARGIASHFLTENLVQVRDAVAARLSDPDGAAIATYFQRALDALAAEPEFPQQPALGLTAQVFLQAIVTGQRHAAVQIAKEALRNGLSLQDLYVDVFQSALYDVGARWESNRLTVAQEHIATAITQYVMAQIYEPPDVRSAVTKGRVVLTGVEGELHSVGAVMVADLLETAGFEVRFLGTNLPSASILGVVRDFAPSHVAVSATMLFNIAAVRQLILSVRSEFDGVRIVVGGAAFRTNSELWRQVSADGYAPDLRGLESVFARTK
jgi:methanogenic corrinoid protein MtbC1